MQAAAMAITVSSGSQASGRPPPLRPKLPWRGPFCPAFSGWLGFCPFDGGRLELSEVFAGSPSFASSAAIRRSAGLQPLKQRSDQRVLLGVAELAEVGKLGHPKLESSRP
jgi:hypothetical protein